MRYRKLSADDDYTFGHGGADMHRDTPETAAQAVVTRLRLLTGEFFLDLTEGTPYNPAVLGRHTKQSYDYAIRKRVLETEGVTGIEEYESLFDGESRALTVIMRINTRFGPAALREVL